MSENETPAQESAIKAKQHFTGTVTKTTMAGALIDIGQPIPGIVHISQLSDQAVNKVEDVLKIGQSVDVWVRRAKADRIELTMIQPLLYDWRDLKPEMIVKGKVVRLETYGAFVEIGAERPGLVHISEMSHNYVKTAQEVVKEGDEIEAKVLDVDKRKKQIRLSMKAVLPEPEPVVVEETPKSEKKSRKGKKADHEEVESVPSEPELTVFQIAYQRAMDKQRAERAAIRAQKAKKTSDEQEDIFSRTLKNRVPTG
jgi:ribosomal protein S1